MSQRKVIQVSSRYATKDGTEKWRNATVGSAFVYDDGTISLVIDPGVSIASIEGVRITIREPFDPSKHGGGGKQQTGARGFGGDPGPGDDDIPW